MAGPSIDVPPANGQIENSNTQFDDDDNNVSVYELFHTFGSSNDDQAPANAALPSGELDEEIQLNKEIACLEVKEQLLKNNKN